MTRATRIYIAGPMTGIKDHNFPAFNAAADTLRAVGWDVVNPADHGVIEGFEWGDYLRLDITKLVSCTDIYLLPGWEHSKGASLEHHIATTLGMNRHYAAGAYSTIRRVVGSEPISDPYRLDAARYQDVCRLLNELLPGWDQWDDSVGNETGLACRAIRKLAQPLSDYASMKSKAAAWDGVYEALTDCCMGWTNSASSNAVAAVNTIRSLAQAKAEHNELLRINDRQADMLRGVKGEAWKRVAEALDEVSPSWWADLGVMDVGYAAAKAIRKLAGRAVTANRRKVVEVTPSGVAFGNAWFSHEKITGFTAAQLNSGECGVTGGQYAAWLEGALNEKTDPSDAVTSPESMMLLEIHAELKRARGLFPGDRIMTLAMAEEFGELVKAVLDEPATNVRKEAVQTAVMAMRVVLDGDGSVNEWRAAKGLDALGVGDAH